MGTYTHKTVQAGALKSQGRRAWLAPRGGIRYSPGMFVREVAPCTATEAAQRLAGRPGLAWLDGECSGARDARYSALMSDPAQAVRADAGHAAPLSVLEALSHDGAADAAPEHPLLPRSAVPRWVGYIAYDAALRSHQRRLPRDDHAQLCFFRYDACLVFDHQTGRVFVAGDDDAACHALLERLQADAPRLLARAGNIEAADPKRHAVAIEQALEHIRRGDIYQVNLARAFTASFAGHPLLLALAMRQASRVPLGFYMDDGSRTLIARTMELFLRFTAHDRQLMTRPIKGTLARRGDDNAEAAMLAADPKERAEHAMIIDLMRNDLGRVAEVGTVRVPEIMAVERYAKLSHLVSTVTCTVREGLGLSAIAQATFPPGSVTGTPKLRAMELIEALEPLARGVYTGAVGAVDRAGGFTLAVAIRTATVGDGQARYYAGGGIVEASDVGREIAETELKARVFRDALAALEDHENLALSAPPLLS